MKQQLAVTITMCVVLSACFTFPSSAKEPLAVCPSSPPERFVDNGDGTICDTQTWRVREQKDGPTDAAPNSNAPRDVDNGYTWPDVNDSDFTNPDNTAFLARLNGSVAASYALADGPGDTDDLASNDRAAHPTTQEFVMNCDETISFTAVDPTIAQNHLPPQYNLYTEDGLAQVLVVIQHCSKAVLDGVEYAPLELNHIWIRREGPFEIEPIPGAVQTVPTFYWYQHHMLTTHWKFFQQAWRAGFRIRLAWEIDLGPLGGTTRTVDVVEHRWHKKEVGYDWIHEINPFPPIPIGINHRVEGIQQWRPWMNVPLFRGRKLDMHARGLIFQSSSDNPVEITAHPHSILGKFGTTLFGVGKDFDMDFNATITTTTTKFY